MSPQTTMLLFDVAHMALELYRQHQQAGSEPTVAELAAVSDRLYAGIQAHTAQMRAKLVEQSGTP